MKIISIANRKGGVGKTTFCINLAEELARYGYRILLLDMDSQCDLTKSFAPKKVNLPQIKRRLTILEVLEGKCSLKDTIIKIDKGIYLVPGNKQIEGFNSKNGKMFLEKGLSSKNLKRFDIILVDYPPQNNNATNAALSLTDYVLIVTEAETLSIHNLNEYITDLLKLKKKVNPSLKILGLVANKVDLRRNLTKKKLNELSTSFNIYFFEEYVSTDTAIPLSLDRKIPVRLLNYRSRTVTQFQRIASKMLERMGV